MKTASCLQVGTAEEGARLCVHPGRPGIPAILQQAIADNRDAPSVGVFASGPGGMLSTVKLACAEHQRHLEGPVLGFQQPCLRALTRQPGNHAWLCNVCFVDQISLFSAVEDFNLKGAR